MKSRDPNRYFHLLGFISNGFATKQWIWLFEIHGIWNFCRIPILKNSKATTSNFHKEVFGHTSMSCKTTIIERNTALHARPTQFFLIEYGLYLPNIYFPEWSIKWIVFLWKWFRSTAHFRRYYYFRSQFVFTVRFKKKKQFEKIYFCNQIIPSKFRKNQVSRYSSKFLLM